MKVYRLHGDNIIECERVANLLLKYCNPNSIERGFLSLACPYIEIYATYPVEFDFRLEFFPGFNKSHNDRWATNILEQLKAEGCFLDETPDIIVTEICDTKENIIVALEFCSALQAGNQAWQRSGRAYSVGRAHCPYIYILDFVKYELDNQSRMRKALRFPNPAVVYSYVAHSLHTNNLVVQAYVKAEEFQPNFDDALNGFPEELFGEQQIAEFILCKMVHSNTKQIENALLQKNSQMVSFLASNKKGAFTKADWKNIIEKQLDIIEYSKRKHLSFKKKIAEKSLFGHVEEFRNICSKYAIGIASCDLPFGLIPAENKSAFGKEIIALYNIIDNDVCHILLEHKDLLVCILKGFKPQGEDNRPDRGALPFASMLLNEQTKVLTFLFGPIVKTNTQKLLSNYVSLFYDNGLWKSVIGVSDLIIVDSPCVNSNKNVELVINNTVHKNKILSNSLKVEQTIVPSVPNRYQENDVDAIIHYIFKHLFKWHSFEGMCNPPGGDWSGLSVLLNGTEFRWLSLPRVSPNGKRPDHVIELLDYSDKPVLLVIESKEKANDLENEIGTALKYYLEHLFKFKPSVNRLSENGDWTIATSMCDFSSVKIISAGAFFKSSIIDVHALFEYTKCDMLFLLEPNVESNKWIVEIYSTPKFKNIATYISSMVSAHNNIIIRVK